MDNGFRAVWTAWALGLLLSACVGGGEALESSAADGPLTGGWVNDAGGCEQRLILERNGRFSLSARMGVGGSWKLELIAGQYSTSAETGTGEIPIQFTPDSAVAPGAVLYCDQWRNRGALDLNFASIAGQTGVDPGALMIRTEAGAVAGSATFGADASRVDRFALYRDANGQIQGLVFEAPAVVAHPLYFALPGDLNRSLQSAGGFPVLNLPQNSRRWTSANAVPQTVLSRLALNVAAAVDMRFSALENSGLPPCDFSFYTDLSFDILHSSFEFAAKQTEEVRQWNPNDPAQFFHQFPVFSAGAQATAHLLPMTIEAPASGGCALSVRARPLGLSVVETLLLNGQDAQFVYPSPGPMPRLLELPAGSPGTFNFSSLAPGLVRGAARLHPEVEVIPLLAVDAGGAPPSFDYLDLLRVASGAGSAVVTETGGERFLSIFGAAGREAGLGPFSHHQRPAAAAVLTPPSSVNAAFGAGELSQTYRLSLAQAARVSLWTEGGLEVSGELLDAHGRYLAFNAGGAADGAGFQIVRRLPPGEYDLTLRLLGAAGAYTLKLAETAGLPFADDGLASCLIEAGWASGTFPDEVACHERGIRSLAGMETLPAVRKLVLNGNGVTDLSPLQGALGLLELSLDGNAVADLSPLGGLISLERLGLAGNPVSPASLPVLVAMDGRLSHLDLRGVTTLSPAEVAQLKQSLINTTIIAPDGTVLD